MMLSLESQHACTPNRMASALKRKDLLTWEVDQDIKAVSAAE